MSDDEDWSPSSDEESEDDYVSEDEKPKKRKAPAAKKTTSAATKKPAAAAKKATTTTTRKKKAVDEDDEDEDAAPKKKRAPAAKKTTTTTKKKTAVDDDDDTFIVDDDEDDAPPKPQPKVNITKGKNKTVEETYQKMELLDQILLRPDTYIGSTEKQEEELWIWEDERMVKRKTTFVPGLYKIFDEILVNAADNLQRPVPEGKKKMKKIAVEIDVATNRISVWNDGPGIPVEMHKKEKMLVPELIFGHLLTSSNYDDTEKRLAGGRNGFGAKLANAFSTRFDVECADADNGFLFQQTFKNNLKSKNEPVKTKYTKKTDYTQITFYPDLSKFGMLSLGDDDNVALLTKRVYDVAGCNQGLTVTLNGKDISFKDFKSYIKVYFKSVDNAPEVYYERVNERWEIAIALSMEGQANQVSFVNSICTPKGGTHVTHALGDVITEIGKAVAKKNKGGMEVKPAFIKNHIFVFVNSLIENPAFDSQTKETLSSKITSFGSTCHPSAIFLKKVVDPKSGIVAQIISYAKHKDDLAMKRSTTVVKKGKVNIPKLDEANMAGTAHSEDCTLILTEGDSAKTLAVAGISVVGWDHYGAFPLKGKLLNVRDVEQRSVIANEEINNLTTIIGLQHGKEYDDVKSLRYGHVMIMTDQDHDGSHIKGLLINFVHHFWPSLLKIDGFLVEFITPIIKVSKKGSKPISFFTIPEFLKWREANNGAKGYEIKYYKGLGTSKPEEGKEYFSKIESHKIDFSWDETADDAIDKAFNKKRADDRKKWMEEFTPGTYLDQYGTKSVSITDFIDKELILFSIADCERSIPSVVDGLKTSQRKILFSCFKRNLKKEIKVDQLIGYVGEHSAYHHGDQSLAQAIIGMAQKYVGSNNVNFLYPGGGFGSRLNGGKDSSAPRYITTKLQTIARALFCEQDDALLTQLTDDGKRVEPRWYMPTIPTILVNGSKGIGTGWSSTIPSYNPRDLVENIKRMLNGEEPTAIMPWYRGFRGTVEYVGGKTSNYVVRGTWKKLDEYRLEITELPIEYWTADFKELIQHLIDPEQKQKLKETKKKLKDFKAGKVATTKVTKARKTKKKGDDESDDEKPGKISQPIVKSMSNQGTEDSIHFIIETVVPVDELDVVKVFKLESKLAETNMTVFDENGKIKQFATPIEILRYFFDLRMQYYQKRKDYLCDKLGEEFSRLSNKARFILAVINKELIISNVKKTDLIKKLKEMKFDQFVGSASNKAKSKLKKSKLEKEEEELAVESENEEDEGEDKMELDNESKGYDYLLSMPLWSLTLERVQKILKERDEKKAELDATKATAISKMYMDDLDLLTEELDKQDHEDSELRKQGEHFRKISKGKGTLAKAKKRKAAPRKPAKKDSDDDYEPPAPAKKTTKAAAVAPAEPKTTGKRKKDDEPTTTTTAKKIDSYFTKVAQQSINLDDSMDLDKDDDDDDVDFVQPAKKTKETVTKPVPPKSKAAPKATTKKAAAATTKKTTKKKASEDDSFIDSDDDDDDTQDVDVATLNVVTRPRRALPQLKYFASDDSGDDYTFDESE
ncbi:hypothetical protein SAMD00019534_079580 [Acytostelium subglobosum LB1]|uniref:hypothetical protein n=1 Tax=Acytostelium subglobosum LB1 TaxID=1410327 RepID=UPI000644F9DF|nr:hypothetical protein SAMD00019534_079580 [Acytostelium subglobosum LB1]GAM24783.1 hypothetical protein SAMD00019534_079580 [Acytostelium subglobosum LB1]|eukprot:XP_012752452.1 hypothetical protein SAMD00019534_079580 [Acytostelium subglobosum LB1]